jgi:hypothetical protein
LHLVNVLRIQPIHEFPVFHDLEDEKLVVCWGIGRI